MLILFVGDVVGEPGRAAVRKLVPRLRADRGVDLVIVNGENSAGGRGITAGTARELLESGADVITSGDHVWDQKESLKLLEQERRILRPANYPRAAPGQGSIVLNVPGRPTAAVLNLQGRTFMPPLENPFTVAKLEVEKLRGTARVIVVDMHAEATSEKLAMGRYLDGQVSAVIGTHTHVQTADEQVFPGGTAFLCDAGFTGPHESILGREIGPVISRFCSNLPHKFDVARDRIRLQGALIEVDDMTGLARSIERISEEILLGTETENP